MNNTKDVIPNERPSESDLKKMELSFVELCKHNIENENKIKKCLEYFDKNNGLKQIANKVINKNKLTPGWCARSSPEI